MTLRLRIALVTAAVLLPTVLVIIAWDAHDQRRAAEDELLAFARALVASPGWLAECEAAPAEWRGGPPPGPPPAQRQARPPPAPAGPTIGRPAMEPVPHSEPARFVAYGPDGRPLRADAPPLDPEGRIALAAGAPRPLPMAWGTGKVRLAIPTGGAVCALMVAEGTTERWLGGLLPATHVWLLPAAAVVAAVLLAVGPVVGRLRRLTRAVHRSADAAYTGAIDVGGRDEIGDLARAFDAAARSVRAQLDETQRREAALRDFVANTTHDVMIPLTVLQGHLAALEAAAPDAEAVRGAMREAHYVGALLHNLGVSARLDATDTPLPEDPVDLVALVERVVARHRPVARGRGIELGHAVPGEKLFMAGDVTLLEQAVGNLVDNALRYNRSGGHVAVVLDRAPRGFALAVIDDGPGIAPGEVQQVLARGGRGSASRTRAPEGRGLGLNITARVAERHGLALRFEHPDEGGLRVVLAPLGVGAA